MSRIRRPSARALVHATLVVVAATLNACREPAEPQATTTPTPAATAAAPAGRPEDAVHRMNVGIAYLEQHKFAQAQKEFEDALALRPGYVEASVNLGIAWSAQVKYDEAQQALAAALLAEPDNVNANYMAGLIHKYKGEKDKALAAFEKVRAVDAEDVDTKFNLATLYKDTGQIDKAVPLLEQVTVEAPHFISAWYALGQLLLRQGQEKKDDKLTARGKEFIDTFQRLSGGTAGETAGLRYGEQGRYGLALEDRSAPDAAAPIAVRFADRAAEAGLDFTHAGDKAGALGSGVLVFDLDRDGDEDVVLAGAADGSSARLFRNDGGGRFGDESEATGLAGLKGPAAGIAAGEVNRDPEREGAVDLLVGGRLLLGGDKGVFTDHTKAAGLAGALASAASLTLVDLDHDGDLDLTATYPAGGGVKAWRNDGQGKFEDVTASAGFAGKAAALSLAFTDFDNDRDIDALVGVRDGAPRLYSNDRELKFAEVAAAAGLAGSGPTGGVTVADVDADGWPDLLITNARTEGHVLYRNTRNRRFVEAQVIPARGPAGGVLFLDADLDGDDDLVIGDRSGLRLFRNDGKGAFSDASAATGLDLVSGDVRGLATGDLDGDGDPDLVANLFGGKALLLAGNGAEQQGWIAIATRGTNSNSEGLGTKVELRAGRLFQKVEVRGGDGFLSQSAGVARFGLGAGSEVDRVRLLWPLGVLQAEIKMASRKRHTVEELDRKGSSCPFLWVWDGEKIAFVSDIQGGSPLGLWLAPGMRNLPDPDEWFLLPDGLARPRDGAYDIRITESLEEIAYLDRVKLRVIDAPPGVETFPNERLLLAPPFVTPGLHLVTASRPLVAAKDGDGRDVTAVLAAIDRGYTGALRRTAFRGFAEPWSLELDFGTLAPAERNLPLVLLAHGYVEFSNSTPMFAAAQAGMHFSLPALELLDDRGSVLATIADAGAPAGLPKWMVLDLTGKVPESGRVRLRYRTNMEVYFDQVRLGFVDPSAAHVVTDLEPERAELSWTGYPTLTTLDGRRTPPLYRYDQLLPDETWTSQEGHYTRFGDVLPLIGGEDDRLVVMSHGDELALRFPVAGLPALPAGWTRRLVLHSVGWAKDLDFHSAAPLTVGPLPYRAMPSYPYPGAGPFGAADVQASLGEWSTRYIRPVEGGLR